MFIIIKWIKWTINCINFLYSKRWGGSQEYRTDWTLEQFFYLSLGSRGFSRNWAWNVRERSKKHRGMGGVDGAEDSVRVVWNTVRALHQKLQNDFISPAIFRNWLLNAITETSKTFFYYWSIKSHSGTLGHDRWRHWSHPDGVMTSLLSPNHDKKQLLYWWLVSKVPFRASRMGGHDRWRHWSHPDGVPRHPG